MVEPDLYLRWGGVMRLSREQRAMLDGIPGSPGGDVMRRQMAVARVFDTAQPVPAHEPLHFCAPP